MDKKSFLMILDELLDVPLGTLTGEEVLSTLMDWNSLAVIGFMALVDERFGITLSPTKIANSKTMNDLISLAGEES